ncbi:MAG: hypothetical protein ACRC5R_02585, partial [Mycoplasmatales bacterium]
MKELILGQNTRKNFSNRIEKLDIPNLNDIQKASYEKLVSERLDYVFSNYFPVTDDEGEVEFRYKGFFFDEQDFAFDDVIEYKNRGLNFTRQLKIKVELFDLKNSITIENKDVFLCELPIITEHGTFVINGVERVIVSQLVRSPDLYVTKERDKAAREDRISGQIMPARGTRLSLDQRFDRDIFSGQKDVVNQIKLVLTPAESEEIGTEAIENDETLIKLAFSGQIKSAKSFVTESKKEIRKNQIKFQFDSSRKINLLTFATILGLSTENIFSILGDNRIVRDNMLIEDNLTFDDAVKAFVNAQIINAATNEEEDVDYKRDIDNIFLKLEERNVAIPEHIENYFANLTNEAVDEEVLKGINSEYSDEIKEFFKLCGASGMNEETSLIKKKEHTYRQKRKTYDDLISRFVGRGYNFGSVGRYKFNLKADLIKNTQMNVNSRFYGVRLAEDAISPKNSKLVITAGTIINDQNLDTLTEILEDGFGIFTELIDNIELGINKSVELQRVKVQSPLHDENLYVIGTINSQDDKMHLDLEDILVYFNYFITSAYGIGKFDDKDHLGNRRVRLVGELVEQEISRGLYEIERRIRRYGFTSIKDETVE